ncbi:hypothetical protein SAMD00019534_121110 [Acytostelium subglobosum LB1]|uniref:hypothetical protein n=1 Tax=Acytostelium subglobosum LB1 TaxID=1410327 RepID=UPI000644D8BF|nr:hypothetical protein SAMD00019534_121110 [Acytostelium subglobosum LB1]GAM28935.1 hypothetical protein SAMD00019534_121110 [Acytostelium subglobosum LB1]|eukprot:XP_012748120.1 hypothetical protein SAMD00019534_121110 [Acytostelium subglobosum LB1]
MEGTVVKLYVDRYKHNVTSIKLQHFLARFFLTNGVSQQNILVVDLSADYTKQAEIRKHCVKIPQYPYVEINGQLWGEAIHVEERKEEIKALIHINSGGDREEERSAVLEAFIENKDVSQESITEETSQLNLGYIDTTINITEWLLFGLVKGLFSYSWQVVDPSGGGDNNTATTTPQLNEGVDFECEVIRTNWYSRHQIRRFRFTPNCFLRLADGHVRETFQYQSVLELTRVDNKNIVIKFEVSESQYIEAVESDADKIIDILVARSNLSRAKDNMWVKSLPTVYHHTSRTPPPE